MKWAVCLKINRQTARFFFYLCIIVGVPMVFAEEPSNVHFSRIDLGVEAVDVQPPRCTPETYVQTFARIHNSGSKAVAGILASIRVYRWSAETKSKKLIRELKDVPVLSNLPRSGMGLSIPVDIGKLPAGDYLIEYIVDSSNLIGETNEDNNIGVTELKVYDT